MFAQTPRALQNGLLAAVVVASQSVAQQPKASIEGGYDESGQNYAWTVTNHGSSAIVFVEIPHFHADTFHTPPGWRQECTNLSRAGADETSPGVLRAFAEPPNPGIAPGGAAQFGLRLARVGAMKGTGRVTVRFADGSEYAVAGVSLPVAPSSWERVGTVVVLGLAFAAFLVFQIRRRKRTPAG